MLQKSASLCFQNRLRAAAAAGVLQTWKLLPAHWAAAAWLLHLDLPLEPRQETQDVVLPDVDSQTLSLSHQMDAERDISKPLSYNHTPVLQRVKQEAHTGSEK